MGERSLKTFELREVSRCIEIFYYKNDIFQNKVNNLATTAIFLLYKKMLSGHKKVKMVLRKRFQYKTKCKRCNSIIQKQQQQQQQKDSRKMLQLKRKDWNKFYIISPFSKRHASESPTITLK